MKNLTKFSLLFLALSMMSMNTWAQQRGSVTGTLIDDQTGDPVVGVVVGYLSAGSEGPADYVSESNAQGKFTITQLPYGDYSLIFSFITYIEDTISVKIDKATVDIGEHRLKVDSKTIETATVASTAPRASVQGDTLTFNADAFKVNQDANAGDLISKMQGVEVDNGKVTFMGESVDRIYLDGKEFFGEDVATAINTIPADMISEVSAFTQLSDQARFTGIEDGNSFRAMNFSTKGGINKATFGQVKASYGFDEMYLLSGNMTFMKDNRKLTLTALSNNMNVNSASEDDLSGGGRVFFQPGVSKNHRVGANYINKWNNLDLSANYNFGLSDNYRTQITERNEFMETHTDFSRSESIYNRENYNHSLNGRIEWQDEAGKNKLRFTPSITINTGNNSSSDTSYLKRTLLNTNEPALVNSLRNISAGDNTGYNYRLGVQYTHVFKPGRFLSVNLSGNYGKRDNSSDSDSEQLFYDPLREVIRLQQIDGTSKSYSFNGQLQYTEPLSKTTRLVANYNFGYSYDDNDRSSYLWDFLLNEYRFSEELSNISSNGYYTHRVGPGINYSNGTVTFNAGIDYQYAHRNVDQEYPVPVSPLESVSFDNVVYNAMLRYKLKNASNLRISVNSRTINPGISQLQDVLDITNLERIYQGNPNLKTTYTNSMNASFNTANQKNAHTFSIALGGSVSSNYITNSIIKATADGTDIYDDEGNHVITIDNGVQYSRPVNLSGAWSGNAFATYGMPVKFIGSNVNLNVSYRYSETPGVFNRIKYKTNSSTYGAGIRIGSNISKNLDFSAFYNFSFTDVVNNELVNADNKNVNHFIMGNVKWTTWLGITLTANAVYSQTRAITHSNKIEATMVNAYLGKKIFNGLGEINVGVNDMLNQGNNNSYVAQSYYTQSTWSNTIGRYVSINFIYNIRNYNGMNPSSLSRGENPQRMERGERPSGPPPGGFGGGGGPVRIMGSGYGG